MSQTGLLIRTHGGFFDVEADGTMVHCRARGRLHLNIKELLPGDRVLWEEDSNHEGFGILTGIEKRKNTFVRPSIANVDQLVFVAIVARPQTDPFLIDQMSVVAAAADCDFLLCINKTDLDFADDLQMIYRQCPFPVLVTSTVTLSGIDALKDALHGKISVLTGNSGVGKTSILNLLLPGVNRETAEISAKHGRGKHTTRLTELFPLQDSGYLADTPGFATLEFNQLVELRKQDLSQYFPEFPTRPCRFPDCLHRAEPDCSVREAAETGEIPATRYQSYLRILNSLSK